MRQYLLVSLIAALSLACEQIPEVVQYNNAYTKQQLQIENQIDSIANGISTAQLAKIELAEHRLHKLLKQAKEHSLSKPSYLHDSLLHIAFEQYYTNCDSLILGSISHIKQLYKIPNQQYTLQTHNQLNTAIVIFNNKRQRNIQQVQQAQKTFADKFNIKLR